MARVGLVVLAVASASMLGCGAPTSDSLPEVPPPAPVRPPPPPGTGDISRGRFEWPLSAASAEAILLKTELFEYGGMPYKRQVQAFNVIFDQPDALPRFRHLALNAEPAGRLYAFCALSELNFAEAVALRDQLAAMDEKIVTFDHDWVRNLPVREVVDLIVVRHLLHDFRQARDEVNEYFRRNARTRR